MEGKFSEVHLKSGHPAGKDVPSGLYALLRLGTKILSIVKPDAPYYPLQEQPGFSRVRVEVWGRMGRGLANFAFTAFLEVRGMQRLMAGRYRPLCCSIVTLTTSSSRCQV